MIHDISPPISPDLAAWPGGPPPKHTLHPNGASGAMLSVIHASAHLGAHADAPRLVDPAGPGIDRVPIAVYVGMCQVIRVPAQKGEPILPSMLPPTIRAARVLFFTGTYPDPTRFHPDFAAFAPETIERLADQGARLVGIDTPSIDLFVAEEMPAHQACVRRDVAILEGLVLQNVPAGLYELIALPLPLVGFDASPVRAVLRR